MSGYNETNDFATWGSSTASLYAGTPTSSRGNSTGAPRTATRFHLQWTTRIPPAFMLSG